MSIKDLKVSMVFIKFMQIIEAKIFFFIGMVIRCSCIMQKHCIVLASKAYCRDAMYILVRLFGEVAVKLVETKIWPYI